MNNKKGISAVVATVLIILITVAAVAIIWAGVLPIINQLKSVSVCSDVVRQVSLADEGYTCKNADNISLQIKRGSKAFDLADIQVLVSAGGTTTSYTIVDDATDSSGVNITNSTDLPGINEEKVFVIDMASTADIDEIQIAPVVSLGNTEELCDVSASKILLDC